SFDDKRAEKARPSCDDHARTGPAHRSLLSTTESSDVSIHHQMHQLAEGGFRHPAELCPGLLRIADEEIDFGGPIVSGIDFDVASPVEPGMAEGGDDEVAERMSFARCDEVVVGMILPELEPTCTDV